MARTKSFDESIILRQVAGVFAECGYAGASIDQLVAATGLKRGSLYQAYASKAGLFRESFRFAVSEAAHLNTVADLLIVALWERAAVDAKVSELCVEAIEKLQVAYGEPIEQTIYQRLQKRAALNKQE